MASTISAGTTTTTALVQTADTSGVLQLQTNGTTTAVTIDTAQNVGVGVTPSAWNSGYKFLQFTDSTSAYVGGSGYAATLGANNYINGSSNWVRVGASYGVSQLIQFNGQFIFNQAASGSVGSTITWTQAMTLNASGNLLVGTTSAPVGGLTSAWANPGSTVFSMGPNGGNAFALYNPSSVGCYVVGGQTGWTGTSDGTLKNVIAKIDNGLSSINGLNPIVYSWKSDETNTPYAGLIAQEVQSVLPDLVNDNNGTLGVNYTGVIPYLISAIQEQQAMITTLQTQVTALKG